MASSREIQETFCSRGIGLENRLTCFVCGGGEGDFLHNLAAFVNGEAGGERVVAMFTLARSHARLDFRESEPTRVQVKVGACPAHARHLEALQALCDDRSITVERIRRAMG